MKDQITTEQFIENIFRTAPAVITRKKFNEVTGGLYSEKTQANLDCLGEGIQPRLRIGGKVAYPKDAAISWLKTRCHIDQQGGKGEL